MIGAGATPGALTTQERDLLAQSKGQRLDGRLGTRSTGHHTALAAWQLDDERTTDQQQEQPADSS